MIFNFWDILSLLQDVFFFLGYYANNNSFEEKLQPEEEARLIKLILEENDCDAKQKMIVHNLRLVAHVCKKYASCSISQEDLLSIGTIGLIKGINTYNPKKATKFASYIAKCIDNEILMAIRNESKLSMNVYLEDIIGADEEGNNVMLIDVVGCEDDISKKIDLAVESVKLKSYIELALSPRERMIIRMRYGLDNHKKYTQIEIAQMLNISRSYVSRIEKKAIEKLAAEFQKLV